MLHLDWFMIELDTVQLRLLLDVELLALGLLTLGRLGELRLWLELRRHRTDLHRFKV